MPFRTQGGAPPQPHDALFQWTFSQRRHAAGLLKGALGPRWRRAVDFRTVRVKRAGFVSPALRRRHGDLVLSARLRGGRGRFYALVEHQRKVERLMILRKGSYIMRLWERLVRDE
ncbi:MAG: Rpn family recombination-promoting nuclease/putative transposase, partial [Polyangiaceae bacterium]|nr:Rpn family recombination-promoting nuclease/putative transposase [Polyangiaceae bacterium]